METTNNDLDIYYAVGNVTTFIGSKLRLEKSSKTETFWMELSFN